MCQLVSFNVAVKKVEELQSQLSDHQRKQQQQEQAAAEALRKQQQQEQVAAAEALLKQQELIEAAKEGNFCKLWLQLELILTKVTM